MPITYKPLVYNPTGAAFAPVTGNLGYLANSVNQINQRINSTNDVNDAAANFMVQLNLNPVEDEWKTNYWNNIQKQIDEAAQFGDYSNALRVARRLARQAVTDPAVRGRARAQASYQKYVDDITKRTDLTEDDKAWTLANNPYTYTDILDSNGNIIGGSEWKPKSTPVGEIDWNRVFATAKQLVHQRVGSNTATKFVDANGNPTDDWKQAAQVLYQTKTGWSGIAKEDLNKMLEAAIDATPGARARIDQEWEVLNWKYDTGRTDESNKELFADNNRKYSKDEWYNNRFGKAVDAMSGMNYTRDIDYNENYFNMKAATLSNGANSSNLPNTQYDGIRGKGTPIEDTNDTFNIAAGKVTNAIDEIEKIGPALKQSAAWIQAKATGNYKKLADIINKTNFITTQERRDRLNYFATMLRNNAEIVSQVIKQGGDGQAYMFNAAFTTGGDLPANNKYTTAFMKDYNEFTKGAETLEYKFDDRTELNNFANSLGLNIDGADAGLVTEDNGNSAIRLNVSDTRNYRAMSLYNPGDIILYNSKNNILANNYSYSIGASPTLPSLTFRTTRFTNLRSIPSKAAYITKRDVGSKAAAPTTYTAKTGLLPQIEEAKRRKELGIIDGAEYERQVKDANRTYLNLLKTDNGSQYKMAALDENGNVLKFLNNSADRLAYMNAIQSRLNAESSDIDLIGTYAYANDIGIRVRIPANYNKTKGNYIIGDIPATEVVIFGVDDPIINSMKGSTNFRGDTKYRNLRKFNSADYTFQDGTNVKWNKNTNGQPVFTDKNGHSYIADDAFVANRFGMQEGYEDIRTAIINAINRTAPNNNRDIYLQNLAPNLVDAANLYNHWMAEYYPNITDTKAAIDYFRDIVNKVYNETKDIK